MSFFLQLLAFIVVAASVHGFVRRDAVDESCALVKKDCIRSGELFKKSVVCASNGKRFINQCALQLRACDLYFDTGEVLMEERCFWIDKEETSDEEEEEEEEEEDEEEGEEEEEGSGMEEEKETSTVMEKFYTTKDTMASPTPNNFMTTGIFYDYFSSQYGSYLDSLNSDVFFGGIPEEPSEIKACSCRGDSICPSCEPSYRKTSGKICGSDGNTYDTECEMDNRRCNEEILDLHMVHEGAC